MSTTDQRKDNLVLHRLRCVILTNKELYQRELDKIAAAKAAEVAKEEARVKRAAAAQRRKADRDAASQAKQARILVKSKVIVMSVY